MKNLHRPFRFGDHWIPLQLKLFSLHIVIMMVYKVSVSKPLETVLAVVCVCVCARAKSLHSCPILCNPTDCSPLGSSVHGILQARLLEWVASPFSKRSSQPRAFNPYVSCIGRQVLYYYGQLGSLFYQLHCC